MKVSLIAAQVGLGMLGAAALIGAAAPVRAQGSPAPPPTSVEGLVTGATDTSLTIHSAFNGDVVLTVNSSTHFRKAGGETDTPDEMPPNGLPAVQTPSPTWFIGLFARAAFDSSHVALGVFLSPPEPLQVNGVVNSVTPTDLLLDVKGRGTLDLTLGTQTCVRLEGLPSTADQLAAGDLVNALYWPTASENDALRIDARTPPPLHFEGVISTLTTDAGGNPTGFTGQRGTTSPVSFVESSSTQYSLDGKTATAADLKVGDHVSVSYRIGTDGNDALSVVAFTPEPKSVPEPLEPGVAHPGSDSPKGGSTGSATPGSNENSPSHGDSGKGRTRPTRPLVFEGQVGTVDLTGMTFTVTRGTSTLTFSVDANTSFQLDDKTAAFTNLQQGQPVAVVYKASSGANLALKVLIHVPEGQPAPGGTGGAQP